MRRSQQAGDDGIGHLVFDDVGRLACPTRMNDHLHIRDVRQCVKRYMLQRPDSGKGEQQHRCKDHEPIACANINYSGKHYMPPVAFTRNCFVAITWPFFWTEMVTCHVPPEPSEPLPSYMPLPLSVSLAVVFIAAMPIAGIPAI